MSSRWTAEIAGTRMSNELETVFRILENVRKLMSPLSSFLFMPEKGSIGGMRHSTRYHASACLTYFLKE
jgi:hypothetical protein